MIIFFMSFRYQMSFVKQNLRMGMVNSQALRPVFSQEPVDWVERKTVSDVRSDDPQAAARSCRKLSFSEKGSESEANPVCSYASCLCCGCRWVF